MVLDNFVSCMKESELKEGHMKSVWVKGRSILFVRKEGKILGFQMIVLMKAVLSAKASLMNTWLCVHVTDGSLI